MAPALAFCAQIRHGVDLLQENLMPQYSNPVSLPLAGLLVVLAGRPGVRGLQHRLCDGVLALAGLEGRRIEFPEVGEMNFAAARLGDG
jgi:hypothetical protein